MKQITFTIVIVCLNAGEKLAETVNSVLKQTYEEYTILIKDGMSTDGSVDSILENDKLRIVKQKDKGIYDAMNQAIGLADGEYLLFLNCGDYLYHEKVLEKVNAWIATDECSSDIYYGNIFNRKTGTKVNSNPRINDFACYRNVPCHQACFYKGSLMKKRAYKPEYKVRADYEHFLWSYFVEKVSPVYMDVTISSYEGGGFSETEKNRMESEREHKEIVSTYMGKVKIAGYRLLLLLTLSGLRTKMAESRHYAGFYNKVKQFLYERRSKRR